MRTFHFYVDDSGTRHPDHGDTKNSSQPDWFALGGVIVEDCNEEQLKRTVNDFKASWNIVGPLHSHPMRNRKDDFAWLNDNAARSEQFHQELTSLLVSAPIIGHGCVIDRRAYNHRYGEYGRNKWSLCKTAFTIAVERAAKYAISQGGRIRIYVERSSKPDEQKLKEYYEGLRVGGNPFNQQRSAGYAPLQQEALKNALFEFRVKKKESAIMQLADLYLYPICRGGYDKNYVPYRYLCEHKKLIDQHLDQSDLLRLGIKYSCFDEHLEVRRTA